MGSPDLTGKTLGGYQILRKLGQGGMATVYQAHEQSLNREVALKVIAPHLAAEDEFVQRFQREAQAAARLSHPNIVPIYSIGHDAGVHYYAMEYVRGRTLAEVIAQEGPMPADRALPIFRQAAEALVVAHEAGIVHRDIKPANIMLDQTGRVRVTDFGIAQIASEKGMTRTGALIGTPEFMSPEQCIGDKPDARSDIYSLGVTFFQVLAGKTPFTAETPGSLLLQIVHGERVPMEELNPEVAADVRDLLVSMMVADREHRVQTAQQVAEAIVALGAGRPLPALPRAVVAVPADADAPTSIGASAGANDRSSRRALLAVAAVVIVALLALAVPWVLRQRQSDAAPASPPETVAQEQPQPAEPPSAPAQSALAQVEDEASVQQEETRAAEVAGQSAPPAATDSATRLGVQAPPGAAGQTSAGLPPPPTMPAGAGAVAAAAPQPAADTVVLEISGEYEYVDLVGAWIEQELGARGFTVVAMPQVGAPGDVARTHLIATAKLVGSRDLQFLGRYETQFTVGLTLRGVDTSNGAVLAGPLAETIEYTARNMQVQLERETRRITASFAAEMRQSLQ